MSKRTKSQIPPSGLDKGTWDYIREPAIAEGYDAGLANDPLTAQDQALVARLLSEAHCTNETVVADFGCGTGRSLLPLLPLGCQVLALDLSIPMLEQLQSKLSARADAERKQLLAVQANLLELDCLASQSVDLGLCLYSTFGMLRGRQNRAQFLNHVVRILKPEGRLVLHAHNLWWQLNFPGGLRWLAGNRLRSLFDSKLEFGDRFADQRNIRQLPIHSFRWRELLGEVRSSGLELVATEPLFDPGGYRAGLVRICRIQAQGWTLVLRKP
ncbi:MAG: class I SAM-dependent methyltransferase [Planctomycetota bacterium]